MNTNIIYKYEASAHKTRTKGRYETQKITEGVYFIHETSCP